MATAFKVGDWVMLNVGGPTMAVSRVLQPSTLTGGVLGYRCQWFAGKKLDGGDFPEDSLIAAPTAPDVPAATPAGRLKYTPWLPLVGCWQNLNRMDVSTRTM
jgi:uncharacterized protein YodC (DUF2158 family)